jgi:hypothetical protein
MNQVFCCFCATRRAILTLSILLILVSCNRDEEIAPVDIMSATPEIQQMKPMSENIEAEIKIKIEELMKFQTHQLTLLRN